ncbi:leucine efflux protein [Acinetobacter schindleri]|uniref:LysE family translocator n=1 Tax=Acinetobacter schindleri TaxID=108981 RepID=UPI0030A26F5D
MNITEYLLYCLAVVIMIATPGPVMLLVASAGLKGGYKHALQTIFGTNFASLVLIGLSILSLKGLLVVNENWLNGIKLLGCFYIAWLGVQIFREIWQGQGSTGPQSLQPVQGGFRTGFLVGISNPKDIIFFAAFFPQFIGISPNLDLSLVILTISWIVLDFLTLSLVYLGFQRLSRFQLYPHLLGLCGLILLMVPLYGIYSIFS